MYYKDVLESHFRAAKEKNNSYSLRSFAKYLEVSPSTLSFVFNLKRPLPINKIEQVIKKLNLSNEDSENFRVSVIRAHANTATLQKEKTPKYRILPEKQYHQIIANWIPYAILALMTTSDFLPETKWIAKRLNIDEKDAYRSWKDLEEAGLIKLEGDQWIATDDAISSETGRTNRSNRESHRTFLIMAHEKITTIPMEYRNYSGMTIAINKSRLKEVKNIIKDFRRKLSVYCEKDQDADEVFRLAIQLFPLTSIPEINQ